MTSFSLPTVTVRGLPFANTDASGLQAWISHRLASKISTVIFTPNAKIGADVMKNPRLHWLFEQADLLIPDGYGVLRASRRHANHPLSHRLPGIEAGEMILRLAANFRIPVYFLGGKPGVSQAAAQAWKRRLPSLPIAGAHHGYFDATGEEHASLLHDIQTSGAGILLVGLGAPMQEQWIIQNQSSLPSVRLFIGLGGSFDVWAGNLRRAPRIFRVSHLEWLWRMLCEPRRFKQIPHLLRYVFGP